MLIVVVAAKKQFPFKSFDQYLGCCSALAAVTAITGGKDTSGGFCVHVYIIVVFASECEVMS